MYTIHLFTHRRSLAHIHKHTLRYLFFYSFRKKEGITFPLCDKNKNLFTKENVNQSERGELTLSKITKSLKL